MKKLKFIDGIAAVVAIACFTPLVIPSGESDPEIAGIPYTMWAGFISSVLLVFLTALVSVIKENRSDGQ